MKSRVNAMRGGACLLLVFYHVVGTDASNGLRISEGLLREVNDWLILVRMPLFAFISGWAYAYRPSLLDWPVFMQHRIRRLALPLLSVGTAVLIMNWLVLGRPIQSVPLLVPVAHLWFIQSLLILLLVLRAFESLNFGSGSQRFVFAAAVSLALFATDIMPVHFGLRGAVYLFPFFLFGMAFQRRGTSGSSGKIGLQLAMLGGLGLAVLAIGSAGSSINRMSVPALLFGIAFCYLTASTSWQSRTLASLAPFSYAIYLLHPFFSSPLRRAIEVSGMQTSVTIQVTLGMVAGVVGPILIQNSLRRLPVLSAIVLGTRWPEAQVADPLDAPQGKTRLA